MRPQKKLLKDEGIIYTGFWEPIHFMRQLGRARQNSVSERDFLKTEDFVKYCADLGINQFWCNFSKGYGLKFENSEQLKIRDLCEHAHKLDLKVIAYCTGGSLTPETLKYDFDNPEVVEDMLARRADGKYASYGNGSYQNWRARPDYTSPDYMDWQKRVVKKAIDFGCDGIHFDNTNILSEPASCRCPRCVRMFREFLAEKYDKNDPAKRELGIQRWGRDDFRYAQVPWYDEWNDPVLHREVVGANTQDWLMFRQEVFANALGEWADYIHDLGGIVEYNCGKGFNQNYRGYGSIDDESILPKADIIFNEGTLRVGYNSKGSPHSRIRTYKVAQAFDLPVMMYNHYPQLMAEAFAFNPGMCGMWAYSWRPEEHGDSIKFFDFYHRYKHYQTYQRSLAEVGVFLQRESMTFSMLNIYMALCSVTQMLQEERLPFRFVYNKDLGDLGGLRLLIIPDMFLVKSDQVEKISNWVRSGGSLLTLGRTGIRDDGFQLRTKLKKVEKVEDLYHMYEPENAFTSLAGEDFTSDFIKPAGEGMAAHIHGLEYDEEPRSGERAEWCIRPELINRPANADRMMEYIDRLLPEKLIRVETGQDMVVDLCRRTDTNEGLVHLFNVSFVKDEKADAEVEFHWPEPVRTLTWIGYDREETPVEFKKTGSGAKFSVSGIRESAVIIVNKK